MPKEQFIPRGRPIVLCLPGAEKLVEKIGQLLPEWQLMVAEVEYFTDGEVKVCIPAGKKNTVRGSDIYIIQVQQYASPRSRQDVFMELCMAVATSAECGARYRTVVSPWFPYGCQDRRRRREPLSARLTADFLTAAGATNVFALDPHNDATQGFFDRRLCNFDGLFSSSLMISYLDREFKILTKKDDFRVATADLGGSKRVKHIHKRTGLKILTGYKDKDYESSQATGVQINGSVEDKTVIIWDDMARTGSTLKVTVAALARQGLKRLIFVAPHADFCGDCVKIFDDLYNGGHGVLGEAIFTDSFSFPTGFDRDHPWFVQITQAEMLADTMLNLHSEGSISHVYEQSEEQAEV